MAKTMMIEGRVASVGIKEPGDIPYATIEVPDARFPNIDAPDEIRVLDTEAFVPGERVRIEITRVQP